jgi:hypothetical protein
MHRSLTPLCAVAVIFAGAATNPATGEKQFSLISEGQEIQMGLMGLDPACLPARALVKRIVGQPLP